MLVCAGMQMIVIQRQLELPGECSYGEGERQLCLREKIRVSVRVWFGGSVTCSGVGTVVASGSEDHDQEVERVNLAHCLYQQGYP